MSTKSFALPLVALLSAAILGSTGCVAEGPSLGLLAIPIPVSPFFQKKKEDEFWVKERYDRVPILPPLTAGRTGNGARSAQRRRNHASPWSTPSRSKAVCRCCMTLSATTCGS